MILEIATLQIQTHRIAEFETTFGEARKIIQQSDGCGQVVLQRSLENLGRYELWVEWPTIAHHMEGFRNSALYTQWRALLGPYFASPPAVEHFESVL